MAEPHEVAAAKARLERLALARAEAAALKAARAEGRPDPDTPVLDGMNAGVPLFVPELEAHAEAVASSRSAAAHKAWETRRRQAAEKAR